MAKLISISILVLLLIVIDVYVYQALRTVFSSVSAGWWKVINVLFWGLTTLSVVAVYYYNFGGAYFLGRFSRSFLVAGLFVYYFPKLFAMLFLFVDDGVRFGKWVVSLFGNPDSRVLTDGNEITRSEFLSRAALVSAAVPMATLSFGILSGAYNYRVRRKSVYLPNLPKTFDGMTIGQLSDIHSGSFYNKVAVEGGVDMLMAEKPDLFVFTGDLVNNEASEFDDYFDVFKKIDAPLGKYAVLGNHDYGDYMRWASREQKLANLQKLKHAHHAMGWDLLLDQHRAIRVGNEEIGLLGIENWGTGRFPKYGDLSKAAENTGDFPVKILLSHDPSHWDAQVRPEFPDIDLMLAGHTHGMQMGVEIGNFRWSPAKYVYKQWADLYEEDGQYIYVNRGFGFIGYPGRVGILPEVTVLELRSA